VDPPYVGRTPRPAGSNPATACGAQQIVIRARSGRRRRTKGAAAAGTAPLERAYSNSLVDDFANPQPGRAADAVRAGTDS